MIRACHSCTLRTVCCWLRSDRMALHAAFAADIVVVYGTRCVMAACRRE
mgnify:CR=1 FL=1